jgi:hypothetical protein
MEASIKRTTIFLPAFGAHLEVPHGGLGAVVWHTFDYREPWATIGAVSEWIAVAAVFRIHHLVQTSVAGSHIGRDELVFASLSLAFPNLECFVTCRTMILNSYVLDLSQWWRLRPEFTLKLLDSLCSAFYLNSHIFRSVVDPALEVVFDSQSVNEWPEAYTLNNASDANRG